MTLDLPDPLAPIRTATGGNSVTFTSASDRNPRMRMLSILACSLSSIVVVGRSRPNVNSPARERQAYPATGRARLERARFCPSSRGRWRRGHRPSLPDVLLAELPDCQPTFDHAGASQRSNDHPGTDRRIGRSRGMHDAPANRRQCALQCRSTVTRPTFDARSTYRSSAVTNTPSRASATAWYAAS